MKYTLFALALFTVTEVGAQHSVALFSSRQDSIQYTQVQAAIQDILKNSHIDRDNVSLDSLLQLQATLRAKIIGFKVTYRSNKNFTSSDDLKLKKVKPDEITKVSFADHRSKKLYREIYTCKSLETLELVNTTIRKIPHKLERLSSLKSIYVYNNAPPARLKLGKNKNIKTFVLRGVEAKKLPRSYSNFTAIEELDLNGNIGLTTFPEIFKNKKLKKLSLIGNQITLTDLPDKKSALEELNLISNKVTSVPAGIIAFPELKKLNFSNNPLTSIDPAIGQLTKLEELSFYNCKLTELPHGIEDLQKLKQIDLYFNELTTLKINIAMLTSLEILYLSNNKLTSLPESIGSATALREIYISNNKLSYLPSGFSKLNSLKVLRMNNNYFTGFPYGILNLRNLENLDLSRNDMVQIPDELATFDKLQILSLVGNPWESKDVVLKIAEALRANGTIVHLNTMELILDDH